MHRRGRNAKATICQRTLVGAVRDRRDGYDLRLSAEAPAVRDALQCLCSHISSLLEEVVTLDAFVVELSRLYLILAQSASH